MDKQVKAAVEKEWEDVKLDKIRLAEEHEERKEQFRRNYAHLLKNHSVRSKLHKNCIYLKSVKTDFSN